MELYTAIMIQNPENQKKIDGSKEIVFQTDHATL